MIEVACAKCGFETTKPDELKEYTKDYCWCKACGGDLMFTYSSGIDKIWARSKR